MAAFSSTPCTARHETGISCHLGHPHPLPHRARIGNVIRLWWSVGAVVNFGASGVTFGELLEAAREGRVVFKNVTTGSSAPAGDPKRGA